jgi:ABC-type bacteriocin/lantibiotic exporter with double-glycine peptidase domain
MNKLKGMFKENWKSIIFSYSLFAINSILMVMYPKVLGDSIDHLIAKDYSYIWYLVSTFVAIMFFGYISRIYDTKVFSGIYRRFASIETNKQIENDVETTKINGRLTLMHYIVQFFERDMLIVLQTIIGLVGAIYFLSLVSWTIVGFLIFTSILILGATFYYSPKIANITSQHNDLSEEQTDVISTRNISSINNLLKRGQHLSLKLSGIDAKFSIWIQGIVYGSVTSLLTYYVMYNNVSVGSVFSTYRYMFDFCGALLGVPTIITSYINIKDVIQRLETEN